LWTDRACKPGKSWPAAFSINYLILQEYGQVSGVHSGLEWVVGW